MLLSAVFVLRRVVIVIYAGVTHQGLVRSVNEDAIGWSEEHGLAFVADGVGGHVGGQLASMLAKRALLNAAGEQDIERALAAAHTAIVDEGALKPELQGMGTTIVLLQLSGNNAKIWWVGDSRAYLLRGRELKQLTVDHSYVEILRDKFKLTDEQIRHHPQRHLVTQTLGLNEPEPESLELELQHGDRLLLCSDGLSDDVHREQLQQIMLESVEDMAAVGENLIQAALDAGGRDNISAVLVDFTSEDAVKKNTSKSRALRWLWIGWVVAAVIAALMTLIKK